MFKLARLYRQRVRSLRLVLRPVGKEMLLLRFKRSKTPMTLLEAVESPRINDNGRARGRALSHAIFRERRV